MGRRPCCAKEGLNRGAWTAPEDKILMNYIKVHGEGKWKDLPQRAGLKRCGKSCRLRWLNYLRPDIKRGNISVEEEELIIRLHKLLGNRWSLIAGRIPGRTDNEIKNYWNTNLSKRVQEDHNFHDSNKQEYSKSKNMGSTSESNPVSRPVTHPVIRTKAVRLTRFVSPRQLDNQMINKNIVPVWNSENPCSSAPREHNSYGFLMDVDVNELLISDVPYSDGHQEKEINKCENMMVGEVEPKSMSSVPEDFPLSGYEVKLDDSMDEAWTENWWESDPFQPSDAWDLKTLEFFLNSENEWLAESKPVA